MLKMSNEERQEIVEFVVMHVATQATFSFDGVACQYLDDQGNRCAIGAMLTDDQCREADDGVYGLRTICMKGWNGWSEDDRIFLSCVQGAHDYAAGSVGRDNEEEEEEEEEEEDEQIIFLREFEHRMRKVCSDFQLRYPEEYL
jgi:hypothetical protein